MIVLRNILIGLHARNRQKKLKRIIFFLNCDLAKGGGLQPSYPPWLRPW